MKAQAVEKGSSKGGSRLRGWLAGRLQVIAPFVTLLFLVVVFAAMSPSFLSMGNLANILRQVSIAGIIATGLTFVILCAEIDLSVASVANATAIVVAFFTLQESYVNIANLPLPGFAAIIMALLACFLLGSVNAIGVTVIGIPSFIMTLAMLQIAAGVGAMLVRGQIAYAVPPLIKTLGSGSLGPVPWIVIICGLFLLVGHLVLTYTRFGRYVYMVGGNREAAEYSGVNVKAIIASVMIICAVCSGVAGMLGVAYFGSAQQNEFDDFLLDFDRRRRRRRHQPLRWPRRYPQHHHRPLRAGRSQQRPRSHRHRQLPQDPDPWPDPARRARHQRLRAASAARCGSGLTKPILGC